MFADASLGMRRIWWLLQCSHLMVPLCIVVCLVGARLTACSTGIRWGVSPAAQMRCLRNKSGTPSGADQP